MSIADGATLATGGGRPVDRARDVARQLRTGTVGHNGFRTDFGIAFGRFKQSGIGRSRIGRFRIWHNQIAMTPLDTGTGTILGSTYVTADAETLGWGRRPTPGDDPVATVESGDVITFDTASHEGLLADQGADPR